MTQHQTRPTRPDYHYDDCFVTIKLSGDSTEYHYGDAVTIIHPGGTISFSYRDEERINHYSGNQMPNGFFVISNANRTETLVLAKIDDGLVGTWQLSGFSGTIEILLNRQEAA